MRELPYEQILRDCRINRIFEGTNEINRMLVPGMIMRKALKGELPFLQAAQQVADELSRAVEDIYDEMVEELGEIDRSSTGYLPEEEHAATARAAQNAERGMRNVELEMLEEAFSLVAEVSAT